MTIRPCYSAVLRSISSSAGRLRARKHHYMEESLVRTALAFLLCLTCGPSLTSAASFDCSKAASTVEQIVCKDSQLSQLDEKLAAAYQAKRLTTSDSNSVREQRQWLTKRNRCSDQACVRTAYEERLAQLATCTAGPTVSAVSAHGAILAADCTVWTWGFNDAGQLGRKSAGLEELTQIKDIPTMAGVVVAHDHTIGIASDGRPYIWGSKEYLACGGDRHPYTRKLEPVAGLPKISAVDGNGRLIALLTETGEVFQLGCVTPFEAGSIVGQPTRIEGLPRISALAVGGSHRLALSEGGEVWSWGGRDPCMRTPDEPKVETQPTTKKLTGLPKIVAISAGVWHAMALDTSGTVWVWGSNEDWQLGIHGSTCESSPLPLGGLPPIKAIATGWFASAAVTEAGKVLFWGRRGLRGFTQPALITNLDEVMSVSLGGNAAVTDGVFVIKRNGDVLKWLPDTRPNYSIPTPTALGQLSSFPTPSKPPFNVYRRQR